MSLIQQSEYANSFNVKEFILTHFVSEDYQWINKFRLKLFENFVKTYQSELHETSSTLLDFSAGAVIVNYISAAPHVAEIVHSAYTNDERKEIELWKSADDSSYDWSPFVKYVVNEVEGLHGESAWKQRMKLLRSKTIVVSCNIYDDVPISPTQSEQFSIVCTSFALESATKSYKDFKSGIQKLVNLLKINGFIAILFVEEQTFYSIGQSRWSVLPVSLNQVKVALEEAGCVVLMTEREFPPPHTKAMSDEKACVFIAGRKISM